MEFSPCRSWLYRSGMFAVTLAAAIVLACSSLTAQGPIIQYGQKGKVDKGPRALGLVQLPSKGKARLIPIAIMMDGKFYDADSYKAAPVPMALDFGIVYEAFQSGVSQGIFTITQPGQLNRTWIAEGTWLTAGEWAKKKTKKYTPPVIEDENGPPVLHRRKQASDADDKSPDKNKDKNKDKEKDKDAKSADTKSTEAKDADAKDKDSKDKTSGGKEQPPNPKAKDQAQKDEQKSADNSSATKDDEQIADPNRPRLRRGRPPDADTRRDVYTKFEALPNPASASVSSDPGKPDGGKAKDPGALAQITTLTAISDAGGPDSRSYIYEVKPEEEAIYRNKMLDLATAQFRAHSKAAAVATPSNRKSSVSKAAGKSAAKLPKPDFDDVILHIFDLSNSNEPVLVLSAKARPPAAGGGENAAEPKEITLIARTNLEGEMQKLFFSQTDSRHLDETPRMELIDAVDADGDGRGELLFRRSSGTGSAYAIYRVTRDRLWPLYEGAM
jgi:hypothetical protein